MREIILNEKATVNAEGVKRNGNAKPVICIDTGEIYTSSLDAANAIGVHWTVMSNVCLGKSKTAKGKRYCYVKDLPNHLEQLSHSLQSKANRLEEYGDVIAEREALEAAERARQIEMENAEKLRKMEEEKRQELIAKAKKKYARAEEKFVKANETRDKLMARCAKADKDFDVALDNLYNAKEELDRLEGSDAVC